MKLFHWMMKGIMPELVLCVQCGALNQALFKIFSESAITLQTCASCHKIIDKYVEYDFTTIFIDLLLLKVSAYRHLLFNAHNKSYLSRLVSLTILSCSYVEWVHGKDQYKEKNNPNFYELGWGYYVIVLQQLLKAVLFGLTFLSFAFIFSKYQNFGKDRLFYSHFIQGMAISYCWNLVTVPSLVWNHYSTYYALSQIALLISCNNTFHVCVHASKIFSAVSISCSYAIQWSVEQWLNQHIPHHSDN